MNARAIKRVLMQNRRRVFWGRRSLVTVRLPRSLFPAPPPDYPTPASLYPERAQTAEEGGWTQSFEGHWYRVVRVSSLPEEERAEFDPGDENGWAHEAWSISKIHGPDPRLAYPDGDHGIEDRHVTLKDTWENDDGSPYHSYVWWEGVFRSEVTQEETTPLTREGGQEFVIDPEIIDQFIARREWRTPTSSGRRAQQGTRSSTLSTRQPTGPRRPTTA